MPLGVHDKVKEFTHVHQCPLHDLYCLKSGGHTPTLMYMVYGLLV